MNVYAKQIHKENKLMVIKGKKWRRNKFEMRLVDMSY